MPLRIRPPWFKRGQRVIPVVPAGTPGGKQPKRRWYHSKRVQSKAAYEPAKIKVPFYPADLLRMSGEPVGEVKLAESIIGTYSVLGGLDWRTENPNLTRAYPVRVNSNGAVTTVRDTLRRQQAYESTAVSGTDYATNFAPYPLVAMDIANDGAAGITLNLTSKFLKDGVTPDFALDTARTILPGEYRVIEGGWVAMDIACASATPNAFRVSAYT